MRKFLIIFLLILGLFLGKVIGQDIQVIKPNERWADVRQKLINNSIVQQNLENTIGQGTNYWNRVTGAVYKIIINGVTNSSDTNRTINLGTISNTATNISYINNAISLSTNILNVAVYKQTLYLVNVVGTNVVNTNVIIATGAGTDKCNGMYTWANIVSGMPSYTNNNGITELYYRPGWNRWYIGDIGGRFTYWYKDAEGSPTNTIFTDIGLNPAPTMVYYGVWNIH